MRLEQFECQFAGLVGLHRQIESVFSDRKPQFPEQFPNQMFATHVVGAMAELYVAKILGVEWEGHINHFSKPDLILIKNSQRVWVEVRYTPKRSDIKVKDSDPDNAIVIGVTGAPPDFKILGYVRALMVKTSYEQQAPAKGKPAWFAPAESHTPIEKLIAWMSA